MKTKEEMAQIFRGLEPTQQKLAKRFNIHTSQVSMIVRGKRPLPTHVAKMMGYEVVRVYREKRK